MTHDKPAVAADQTLSEAELARARQSLEMERLRAAAEDFNRQRQEAQTEVRLLTTERDRLREEAWHAKNALAMATADNDRLRADLADAIRTRDDRWARHKAERELRGAVEAERDRLRAEIRQGVEALRPFGGGDLLTGVKQVQNGLQFEIDEHQRHHDSESLLIAERDRLRAELKEARDAIPWSSAVSTERDRLRAVLADTPENVAAVLAIVEQGTQRTWFQFDLRAVLMALRAMLEGKQ